MKEDCIGSNDLGTLVEEIQNEIQNDQFPIDLHLLKNICSRRNIQGHLVVLVQPYLDKIISEEKVIESRFSKPRIAPFQKVKSGDFLFLKQAGGPLLGITVVSDVLYFGSLETEQIEAIFEEYKEELALEESFKRAKRDSKYGTLIFLSSVMATNPIPIKKSDRRSWVVLNK